MSLSLNQFIKDPSTNKFIYGYNGLEQLIPVIGAPEDINIQNWAMLHNGNYSLLYIYKKNSRDTLYQFVYDQLHGQFVYRGNSITLNNVPVDARLSGVAMLHDGEQDRLYLPKGSSTEVIYQFAYCNKTGQFEHLEDFSLEVSMGTSFVNWHKIAMAHDGTDYHLYCLKFGSYGHSILQAVYNKSEKEYQFGYKDYPELQIVDAPEKINESRFSALHDGEYVRLYTLTEDPFTKFI